MSTVKANTYQDASGGSNAILYGAASPAGSMGFRNRIINGDMRIDQRNAGAAVTCNSTTATYCVDRFFGRSESTDGVYTLQQTTTAPANFVNSLKVTVTTADASIGSTQRYQVQHRIEGYNTADFGWGTANAKTVTLSFWVRSSLTGTFGGSFANSDATRSYPFTYTISSADTWEQKTVTVSGDTSGTWLTNSGIGVQIIFALGTGSTYLGTPGSWSGNFYTGATGQTQVISTNGATFYITGVQLEVGSVATEFERRPYGTELALCQRYFFKIQPNGNQYSTYSLGYAASGTDFTIEVPYPVNPRTSCTGITTTAANTFLIQTTTNFTPSALNFLRANTSYVTVNCITTSLTGGQGGHLIDANNDSSISFNGMEL